MYDRLDCPKHGAMLLLNAPGQANLLALHKILFVCFANLRNLSSFPWPPNHKFPSKSGVSPGRKANPGNPIGAALIRRTLPVTFSCDGANDGDETGPPRVFCVPYSCEESSGENGKQQLLHEKRAFLHRFPFAF